MGLAPPVITAQPLSQTILVGEPATFTVAVGGSSPFTYRWQKDGLDLSGATGPSLTIPVLQLGDSGSYTVVVTNGASAVTSDPATLIVTTSPVPPSITVPPAATTVVVGHPAQLTVKAAGSTPLLYQWIKDDAPVPGATASILSIASASTAGRRAVRGYGQQRIGKHHQPAARLTVIVPPPSRPRRRP